MASVSSCQDLGGLWMDLCLFLPVGILTSLHWLIEKRFSDFIFLWTLIILSLRPLRGSVAKQWYHPSFPRDIFEKAEAYLFKFYWISWVNIGTELGQPYFVWDGGHSANFLELGSHFLIWINMSMWLCFLGVSIHFSFKIYRVRQQSENMRGWTRQALQSACKAHFWLYHPQEQFKVMPTISLHRRVPTAALHSMQIVTSSEGSNGKMSANGEKNRSVVSGQYCYWRYYYYPRAFFFPQATDPGHRCYLFYYPLGILWGKVFKDIKLQPIKTLEEKTLYDEIHKDFSA